MALTDSQKRIGAMLAQKNTDADYLIRLANDSEFVVNEITSKRLQLIEELLKEKTSHEAHILELQARVLKIAGMLEVLEG
jgi:hypothetical protein